jgi:DNA-binding NarL/FixJ family response regulator
MAMARKKTMTEEAFAQATQSLDISERSMDIARRVLVTGERQKDVAKACGLTPQTVSDHVQRVWQAHCATIDLPPGTRRITVVLSEDKANIVLAWEREEQIKRIALPSP